MVPLLCSILWREQCVLDKIGRFFLTDLKIVVLVYHLRQLVC